MNTPAQAENDGRVARAFFAYLKKSLQRSARNYIYADNLCQSTTVFLEDITQQEPDNYPDNAPRIVRTRENFHFHLENELLAEHIPELEKRERDILFLLFYDRMTTIEAAEVLGVSQQNVSKQAKKLLGRLKCLLA